MSAHTPLTNTVRDARHVHPRTRTRVAAAAHTGVPGVVSDPDQPLRAPPSEPYDRASAVPVQTEEAAARAQGWAARRPKGLAAAAPAGAEMGQLRGSGLASSTGTRGASAWDAWSTAATAGTSGHGSASTQASSRAPSTQASRAPSTQQATGRSEGGPGDEEEARAYGVLTAAAIGGPDSEEAYDAVSDYLAACSEHVGGRSSTEGSRRSGEAAQLRAVLEAAGVNLSGAAAQAEVAGDAQEDARWAAARARTTGGTRLG